MCRSITCLHITHPRHHLPSPNIVPHPPHPIPPPPTHPKASPRNRPSPTKTMKPPTLHRPDPPLEATTVVLLHWRHHPNEIWEPHLPHHPKQPRSDFTFQSASPPFCSLTPWAQVTTFFFTDSLQPISSINVSRSCNLLDYRRTKRPTLNWFHLLPLRNSASSLICH